ncbi:MAG: lysine--tRNA ligase [Phycisphaerales bacterium]|nr:lysine--tRNA ligase [Phycisphaerales bacterium]
MAETDRFMQERERKREALRAAGVDPYGGRFPDVEPTVDVRARADVVDIPVGQKLADFTARMAGRITLLRDIGKLAFLTVQDRTGTMQFGLSKGDLGDAQWTVFKQLDLGDIIGGEGIIGRTKTGELTLWLTRLTVLAKALRPPPEKWHGLTDVELRYRHRYVDLFSNREEVYEVFRRRSAIIHAIREYLVDLGYLEVDTPVLQPIYGGAAARPFVTHHNTLDMDLFLRISPELYLKRLLVGGMERVFEISRNFRNEGISPRHNPEFSMIELYEAYADYHVMMERTEGMVAAAIEVIGNRESPIVDREAGIEQSRDREGAVPFGKSPTELSGFGGTGSAFQRPFGEHMLNFAPPWRRAKYADLFREHAGLDIKDKPGVLERAKSEGIYQKLTKSIGDGHVHVKPDPAAEGSLIDHDVLVNELFDVLVQPHLIQPTFVYDYPASICPLTRRHPEDPSIALRFEAFVAGMELGNAYTELNDPRVQEENFRRQVAGEGDETMAVMDEDFVTALEYGMPPAGGLGVGIDRMVMLLTNSRSIRDVILFPLQRKGGVS